MGCRTPQCAGSRRQLWEEAEHIHLTRHSWYSMKIAGGEMFSLGDLSSWEQKVKLQLKLPLQVVGLCGNV